MKGKPIPVSERTVSYRLTEKNVVCTPLTPPHGTVSVQVVPWGDTRGRGLDAYGQ